MAEYNPSKIIKDGNTYNFRDDTKIPLAGSNAISGSLIPSTDNSIDIGSSAKNIKMLYTKGITIDAKTIDTDANGNMTYDGHIVDTIEEQGDGYIRYSNGIQICWGTGTFPNAETVVTYPRPFAIPNEMSVQVNDGEGLSTYATSWAPESFTLRKPAGESWISWLAIGRWK